MLATTTEKALQINLLLAAYLGNLPVLPNHVPLAKITLKKGNR